MFTALTWCRCWRRAELGITQATSRLEPGTGHMCSSVGRLCYLAFSGLTEAGGLSHQETKRLSFRVQLPACCWGVREESASRCCVSSLWLSVALSLVDSGVLRSPDCRQICAQGGETWTVLWATSEASCPQSIGMFKVAFPLQAA